MVLGTVAWLTVASSSAIVESDGLRFAREKIETIKGAGLICDESYALYSKYPLKLIETERTWEEQYKNPVISIRISKLNRKVVGFWCDSPQKVNGIPMSGRELMVLARKTLMLLDDIGTHGALQFSGSLDKDYENPHFQVEKTIDGVPYVYAANFQFDTSNRHLKSYSNHLTDFRDPGPKPSNVASDEETAVTAMNFVAWQPGVRFVEATVPTTAIGSPGPKTRNGFDFRDNFRGLYDRTRPSYFRAISVYELNAEGGRERVWLVNFSGDGRKLLSAERMPKEALLTLSSKVKFDIPDKFAVEGKTGSFAAVPTSVPKDYEKSQRVLVGFGKGWIPGWRTTDGTVIADTGKGMRAWKTN